MKKVFLGAFLAIQGLYAQTLNPLWVLDYNPGYHTGAANQLRVNAQNNILFSIGRVDTDSLNGLHSSAFGLLSSNGTVLWDTLFPSQPVPPTVKSIVGDDAGNTYYSKQGNYMLDFIKVDATGNHLSNTSLADENQFEYGNNITSDESGDALCVISDELAQKHYFFTEGIDYTNPFSPTFFVAFRDLDMNTCTSTIIDSVNSGTSYEGDIRSFLRDDLGDFYALISDYRNPEIKGNVVKIVNNQITSYLSIDSTGYDLYMKNIHKIDNFLLCNYIWNADMSVHPPINALETIKIWNVSSSVPVLVNQHFFRPDMQLTQIHSDQDNYYFGERQYINLHTPGIALNKLFSMSKSGVFNWTFDFLQDEFLQALQVNHQAVLATVENVNMGSIHLYVINKYTGATIFKYNIQDFYAGVNTGISQIRVDNGSLYIAGSVWAAGRMTARFAKYKATTDVSRDEITEHSLSLYPNPTQDLLYFNSPSSSIQYRIYDVQGKLIKTESLLDAASHIKLEIDAKGIYLLEVENLESGETYRQKFIKQ